MFHNITNFVSKTSLEKTMIIINAVTKIQLSSNVTNICTHSNCTHPEHTRCVQNARETCLECAQDASVQVQNLAIKLQ